MGIELTVIGYADQQETWRWITEMVLLQILEN